MYILVVLPKDDAYIERLKNTVPGDHTIEWMDPLTVKKENVARADIIIGNAPAGAICESQRLQFLQLNSAGYDNYLGEGILAKNTILANATGAYGIALTEHMLGELLALIKKLNLYEANRIGHAWKDEGKVKTIYGSTTLVLGAGDIGGTFGRVMHMLGSKVIGIRRGEHAPADYMMAAGTMKDIDKWLPEADYVFSAMPSTPETVHFMNEERMQMMKKDAILLNVGRGSLIETSVLVKALKEGWIGGACLDVTEPEPLPAESELWDCPNLIVTPHVSGNFHARIIEEKIQEIALENLLAYLAKEPMKNIVKH